MASLTAQQQKALVGEQQIDAVKRIYVGMVDLKAFGTIFPSLSHQKKLALARLLRKFFQNLRYGRERPKVARKLRSLAGGWAPLYGRAAAEEIFSEVI